MPRSNKTFKEPRQLMSKAEQFAFNERANKRGLDWREVNSVALKAALLNATAEGVAIMFSGAAGGHGICMRLLLGGDKREVVYAMTAEDFNQYLDQVVAAFGSDSEDTMLALAGGK